VSVVSAIGRELLADCYIQTDKTPVDVEIQNGRGNNHHAYLWKYGPPEGTVVSTSASVEDETDRDRFWVVEGLLQIDDMPPMIRRAGWEWCTLGAVARKTVFFWCAEIESVRPGGHADCGAHS
jgi:hypothetical protein